MLHSETGKVLPTSPARSPGARPGTPRGALWRKFSHEVANLGLPTGPGSAELVTSADLAPLPEPAQRLMRFAGVVGRPRDWSLRMRMLGRFRTSDTAPWRACETWQYNSSLEVARIFYLRLRMAGVPFLGRDTYQHFTGRMYVRALDLVTVTDGTGPTFDTGELITYVNDVILYAPSMLLSPSVTWSEVDSASFDVTLEDGPLRVTGRVFVDGAGRVTNFSTEDRFFATGKNTPVRTRWTTPVEEWITVNGRPVPLRAHASWHLPSGELTYVEATLDADSLRHNVLPGE